jgi:hypothetical protein
MANHPKSGIKIQKSQFAGQSKQFLSAFFRISIEVG